MVPGKKNILSGGRHLLCRGRHLISGGRHLLCRGRHLISGGRHLIMWRPPDNYVAAAT